MRGVESGDVILFVVEHGQKNVIASMFAAESADRDDMIDPDHQFEATLPDGTVCWKMSASDLFLTEYRDDEDDQVLLVNVSPEVVERVQQRGFYWELRARVRRPLRTVTMGRIGEYY